MPLFTELLFQGANISTWDDRGGHMDYTELSLKAEYRSFTDDIINTFYVPLLSRGVLYQRAVGFFSSSALIEVSYGIGALLKNGGRIQLIVSPHLQEWDIEAIERGYEERLAVVERAIMRAFVEPKTYFECERLNLLASLVADGRLDIKVAFVDRAGIGIYHEKLGLVYDKKGNTVAFTGSLNETATAFSNNYETIDVFCSWTADAERVRAKATAFKKLWDNDEPKMTILDFPSVARNKLQAYRKELVNLRIDDEEFPPDDFAPSQPAGPRIPKDLTLHEYQLEAINSWETKSFRGIFDMATGTGKTYTGLGAVVRLFERLDQNLAIVIVCPFQHLVEQWVEDIERFNMKPIIGYSASKQRDWKRRLKESIVAFSMGVKTHFCFVTTNATFSSEFVRTQVNSLIGNVVLIIDEAHNFGAARLQTSLNPQIPFRLALSATLERHGDEEGTEILLDYFGEKCIEYSLERAIREEKLTPYYYHPEVIHLSDNELLDYKRISKDIAKHCRPGKNGKLIFGDAGKMLLIKRARIVAGAQEKVTRLADIMTNYQDKRHMLVYCGAATSKDTGYEEGRADTEEIRQIDAVAGILGNTLGMRISKFTSEESAEEREQLKRAFSEGQHIQVLVAIRCLDEGVNIPSIKTAFILASSTNPKEYIQRRGRVLRRAPGKTHAIIYDFITLPRPLDVVRNLPSDQTQIDLSLVRKEIARMRDFASIALNPSVADSIINQIEDVYDLTRIGGDDHETRWDPTSGN